MNKFIHLIFVLIASVSFGQGDDCFNATSIGSVPAPPGCPGGGPASSSLTYNGTTNGATAENPYSSLSCMDAPAADVWVTFTASGNEMDLDFSSGLNDANIGIYTGDCSSGLTGLFCESSNNGNISTSLTPLVPGETYYMQISGADPSDFSNFTLDLTAINNCDLCVLSAGVTASPAPTNGFYTPGTTVEFCMTINEFEQVGSNWLAGVVPDFGSSWDLSTLTPTSSPNAGNGYEWEWGTHPTLGEGYFVDGSGGGPFSDPDDDDYENNYGDPDIDGTGSWTFCFEITTSTNCTTNGDLSMSFDTYSDFETGGYGTPGCSNDPVFPFTAFMLCCDPPITSFTNESCPGANDGTFSATGQGGTAPYDYVFENSSGTVVYSENNVADGTASTATGLPADTYTVIVTDDNGCSQTAVITITVPPCPTPTMDPAPADVTVECIGDVPAMTNLTWNDVCMGTGSVAGTDGAIVGGNCGGTITRTWTYTNPCGNSVSATQTITVDDTQAPVLDPAPADVTVECIGDVPAMTNLGWTDNCDGTGTVAGTDGALAGGPCGGTITRTWTYTDVCGNPATATQTITIDDTTPPVLAAAPADVTVECIGDVPAMTNLGWTDNCDGTGTVAGTDGALAGGPCGGTITRTWTYTDVCGNPATATQTITVDDTQAPVLDPAPADVTVECIGDVPAMTNLGWTDNCDGTGTVAGTDGALAGGPCGGTITRTWTYTDVCGNPATATQTITIDDTTPPVFAAAPADVTVECIGDVPAMVNLAWTDNCDGAGTVAGTDGALTGGSCGGTITRTWTYTDVCGNPATATQTITVDDTQAPVFDPAPAVVTVECIGDVPAMVNLAWTDNCDGTGTVAGTDGALTGGSCGGTITRTWTYTDVCGNPATTTQTITVDDTQAPVFDPAPADVTVECIGDVPAMTNLGWTDNCDGTGTVAGTDGALTGGSCGGTITRTWTYTDVCGNPATTTQTITVDDTQAPVLDPAPADVTVECIGDVPAMTNLGWTDNCDGTGTVAGTDGALTGGSCGGTITRTWTYTDVCGNPATTTQTITVDDTQAPVLDPAPADVTVECIGDVPAMTNLGWTDNCDGTGTVAGTDGALAGGPCGGTITRTWTYTDVCGNPATATQTITVDDTQAPVFDPAPADVTVECIGDVPAMTNLAWTDNCDGTGTVAGTDGAIAGGNCGGTITRTWTYTDVCGNPATATQIITVDDTQAPTASNPDPISATGSAPAPDVTVVDDEADNCTTNPTVAFVDDVTDGGNCPEIITRTYSVTDDCGNQILVEQTITIGDAIIPTASNPDPITVQCIGDVPAPDETVVDDEADNGAQPVVTWEDDTSDGQTCPETITRRYRVTDDCGNFIFVEQTITVDDTQAPVFDPAPADVTVECIGDVPAMTNLGWTDNCDGTGTVAGTDGAIVGGNCGGTITRTWTYTDVCGNPATTTQTITVDDTQAPVFDPAPADITVECIGDVPAMTNLGWTDNCDGTGTVAGTDGAIVGGNCGGTITRTWTYTDVCGNPATTTQTITVDDTQAPVFDPAPADVTVECIGDVPAMTNLGWTDNCDGTGTVAGTDGALTGGSCGGTITRTWTYTDVCGNPATTTQTITVDDTQVPVLDPAPADVTVECIGDVPAMTNLGWTDNCDGTGTVAGTDGALAGGPCGGTITRTWTYTDVCGNPATATQTITIDDTTPPVFAAAPADVTVECIGDVPAMVNLAWTDNCDGTGTVAGTDGALTGGSCGGTITRTWTYTDVCGNPATATQTITVDDTQAPVFDPAPADVTVECIGDVPAMTNLAWTDNCDGTGTVAGTDGALVGGSCGGTITRTWTYTDVCGNPATTTQTITVDDTQDPTASNPLTTTVECATDVPAVDPAVVTDETDNCTVNPTVTFISETSDNNVCNGEELTRTYEIADDCGNTITVTHTIIIDSYTPTFTVAETDPTVCGGTDGFITISGLDPNTDYLFSYNSGATTVITTDVAGEYVITGLSAGTYTGFTVSDADCPACSTTDGSTITLTDPNPPALDAGPDQEVCEGSPVTLTADNPDVATVSWDNGVVDGVPFTPGVGTVTYTVTADLAGCTNTDQVDVTVVPTIDGLTCPGQLTAVCDITEQPAYADFDAFIADGGSATIDPAGEIDSTSFVMISEVSDGLSCPETVTRTYEISDTCGVTATCTQDIVIHDLVDPTGSNPSPVTVQCAADVPAPDETVVTDEADNCTVPTVTHMGDATDGLSCPETITRTYRIEDACGNFIEVQQLITIDDDIDPTGTAPADVTVQCAADVPAEDPTLITDEADNCATPTVTHVGDVTDGLSCPETITRTYRIEDACGNFIEVDQIITVDDDINPTGTAPADVTVECASDVPAADPSLITDEADNCLAPTVTHVGDVSDGNTCNGEVITRTYRIEDACGNFIEVDQTITIDSYTPSFTIAETDPTICGGTDGYITISGLDPNTDYILEYNGGASSTITTNASGEYEITGLGAGSYISFTVSDADCPSCSTTDGSTISLTDPNAPAVDAGPDQTICDGESVTLTAGNPDGANITWDNGVTDDVAFTPSVGSMDYTVTAELSNCISTDVVTVTVNPLPNVNAGNDIDICGGDQVILTGSGADSYTWDNGVVNGEPFTPSATTTYTVTGSTLGCESTDDLVVTIVDNPVVDFIADTTEGCVPLTVNFSNLTQGSVANCTYTLSDGTVLNGCDITYTFTQAGCYDVTLEVENATGCVSTTTIQDYICVESYPIAGFQFEPGELSNLVDEVDFTNSTMGGSTYEWSFGDGATSTNVNPSHVYDTESDEEEYEVTLVALSEFGCADTISAIIPVIEELIFYVPNTFTPDSDNFNETFKPVFTSGFDPQDYLLLIFNRWGEVVFESRNAEIGWDGTFGVESNEMVKDGTYVWKIEFKTKYTDERKVEVGHVNILR